MSPVDLKSMVRAIPDYPTKGVVFQDLTALLQNPAGLREAVRLLARWARSRAPDLVIGGEARGLVVGAAMAYALGCGFAPARRPGKLPLETRRADYQLEYGSNSLELQVDAVPRGARVVIHDDVLATAGTSLAIAGLVEELGGEIVGVTFLSEVESLRGRDRLARYDVCSLIRY